MDIIKSATFSFVRFEHPVDNDYSLDIPFSLPAFEKHNIGFQFIVDTDRPLTSPIKLGVSSTNGLLLSVFSPEVYAAVLSYKYRLTSINSVAVFDLQFISINSVTIIYNQTVTPGIFAQILSDDWGVDMVDDYFVLDAPLNVQISATHSGTPMFPAGNFPKYWHQAYIAIANAPITQTDSFTYALLEPDDSVIAYSNEFKITDEEEFTTLARYYGDENSFEFVYDSANRVNIIRLPIFLLKPQFPKKSDAYRKSGGVNKLLSAYVQKEYEISTDQMPEVFHECMTIMLSHDNVTLENINIREGTVKVVESDNYNPQWPEDERLQFAPGKGKIKVATFGQGNSNC